MLSSSFRTNASRLLRTPSTGSPAYNFRQSPASQLRTYLLLSTTRNPKTPPQIPKNLPAPPKTIILLTTPESATSITPELLTPLTNDSTATVLSAAVDSLPGVRGGNGARIRGHSWLITDHTLPIRSPRDQEAKSLTFALPTTSFTLPLANTVFQNGKVATCTHLAATAFSKVVEAEASLSDPEVEEFAQAQQDIQEAWEELGDLMKMVGVKSGLFPHVPVPLDSVEINISGDVLADGPGSGRISSYLPVKALTPPREIEEGFGNILRELATPAEIAKGASRELEAAVDSYLASLPEGTPTPERVDVFARVTTQQPSDPLPTELLLYPGTRIHRVLSGGGGWGNKAGLLSLDPQDSPDVEAFAEQLEERFDGKEQTQGIVQKGQWVQFFVAEGGPVEGAAEKGIIFGAVGKVEDNKLVEEEGEGEEKMVEGLFGAAAEMGVDVGVAGKGRRMNVPGGIIVVDA
ncbi:hypothetical protein FPQ18DRAFT_337515 [Pyronema domesticum]|uniref:Uncharacterized protein n=1 Tax=Pyronema omphalodes (strain CBS 100304) TaxID=1076935 RepID=U4LUB5_PYROM|nr:hypothetical protein FPQ18DRAFT_337515 [Pyronema domesticum]CCX31511.1 Similar to hypothetical protein [Tuber melanosporum Mel28]; acc. no. XP_002841780 [Pyronema omphalodes CBS 100304]